MKVNVMDAERIAISEIHNIESIRFSDIGVAHVGSSKTSLYNELLNDGNTLIKPMLTISYDGTHVMVLTSDDINFDYYVKKVREVYLKEKDKYIEGSLLKRKINIDDLSKKILLSDTITQTSDLYSFYDDKESYKNSLISSEREIRALLPLIEYVISSNLSNIGKTYNPCLEHDFKGYAPSGTYTLYGYIDGIFLPIPMHITKDNNIYHLTINNVFEELNPLSITINFNRTSLDIISSLDSLGYESLESFKYVDGTLKHEKEIHTNDKCVYVDPVIINDRADSPNLSKIDEDDNLTWFNLPWGAKLGFKDEEVKIDNFSKTCFKKIQYIDSNEEGFINIESAEERFKRKTADFRDTKDLVFDDVDKTMIGFKDNNTIFIETSFSENGTTGEYKDKFADKKYYHFSSANTFDEITKDNIYPVRREYDIYEPGDLKENYKIRRIAKRK